MTEICYYPKLKKFISSCSDKSTALLLSDIQNTEAKYFKQKKGVRSFDYSIKHNVIVSGGRHANVFAWSPSDSAKPVMIFKVSAKSVYHLRSIVHFLKDHFFKILECE